MVIKNLIDEDFVNYKKPSMFIITPTCSFKCDKENGCNLCQNSHLAQQRGYNIGIRTLIKRYLINPITKAIVIAGLEPFDTPDDLFELIDTAREWCGINDDIVIYTGYTEEELRSNPHFKYITEYPNIIIKFGRFIPNEEPHYDEVLGVKLASNNQYARRYNFHE